ncbi:MAG: hypothetical protein ABSB49_08800 [Polyangia bacterium]
MRSLASRLLTLALVLASGCSPEIDRSIALVTRPRVLAVQAEPPESPPGSSAVYTALAATPTGVQPAAGIAWSLCASPAQPSEDSPVSSACVLADAAATTNLATGNGVSLVTPVSACDEFGPLGMPTLSGSPATQASAPDVTGGYYQPVRLLWDQALSFAFERLACPPVGVPLDLAQAYRAAYRPNQNPQLLAVSANGDGDGAPLDVTALAPGSTIALTASWTPDSAESYVTIDVEQDVLLTQTETLWLAWFVTGGQLASDYALCPAGATSAANRWQAPAAPGTYYLWTVLHDDRGGVDFATTSLTIP